MIKLYNPLGPVCITGEYFSGVVSTAARSCYGVCGMATRSSTDGIRSRILSDYYPDTGVRVTAENGRLIIELHIKVTYGVNITAIVKSIANKVKYAVEDATTLKVGRVNVYVDGIV